MNEDRELLMAPLRKAGRIMGYDVAIEAWLKDQKLPLGFFPDPNDPRREALPGFTGWKTHPPADGASEMTFG